MSCLLIPIHRATEVQNKTLLIASGVKVNIRVRFDSWNKNEKNKYIDQIETERPSKEKQTNKNDETNKHKTTEVNKQKDRTYNNKHDRTNTINTPGKQKQNKNTTEL